MKTVFSFIGAVILLLLMILFFTGLGWFGEANSYFMAKVFRPKYAQVDRETFEQSKSYQHGMVQNLNKMKFEYIQATPEQQASLRSIILQQAAEVDPAALTPDLNAFIAESFADSVILNS